MVEVYRTYDQTIQNFLSTKILHLSLTTRCNLKCPFCARTENKNRWFGNKNVDLSWTDYKKFFDDIKKIEPFGTDNPAPTFLFKDLKIIKTKILNEKHISLILKSKIGFSINSISFNSIILI